MGARLAPAALTRRRRPTLWLAPQATYFVRYAHEMNGVWFQWAQRPSQYRASFAAVAGWFRAASCGAMMVWAPNWRATRAAPAGCWGPAMLWPSQSRLEVRVFAMHRRSCFCAAIGGWLSAALRRRAGLGARLVPCCAPPALCTTATDRIVWHSAGYTVDLVCSSWVRD